MLDEEIRNLYPGVVPHSQNESCIYCDWPTSNCPFFRPRSKPYHQWRLRNAGDHAVSDSGLDVVRNVSNQGRAGRSDQWQPGCRVQHWPRFCREHLIAKLRNYGRPHLPVNLRRWHFRPTDRRAIVVRRASPGFGKPGARQPDSLSTECEHLRSKFGRVSPLPDNVHRQQQHDGSTIYRSG